MVVALPRTLVTIVPRRLAPEDEPYHWGWLPAIVRRLRADLAVSLSRSVSQEEIGGRAGFRQGYYSNLEAGHIRRPGDDKLQALEQAFDLVPGTLKEWMLKGPPFPVTSRERFASGPPDEMPEWLALEPSGSISGLWRGIPSSRRAQAAELARRTVIETFRVMAEDEPTYDS